MPKFSNEPQPILAAWSRTLSRHGEEPAVLAADGGVLRTFKGIEHEARELEICLGDLQHGSVAAVQLGNDPRLPAVLIALWRRGIVPILLDRAVEKDALSAALNISRAGAHITRCDDGKLDLLHFASQTETPPRADFLKLTSGTTGTPRAIRFTAAQLLADCDAVCETMGIGDGDVNFGVIPWSHSYGFSNLVTPLLCRGVSLVASEERLPRAILEGLLRSGATVFPGLPVFFQKLCALNAPPLPRLRLCISAGAPLDGATAAAFRAKYGVKIHSFYGSSECGGIAYDASDDDVPEGCVGEPMRGVKLTHDESTGRIEVRGPAVGEGYFPEADDAVLGGGRFIPGDLVRRTTQGLLLTGRVSDFINVAGRKLNPVEVETVLRKCPGVRDAVVFGVASALRGEEPVACIVGELVKDTLLRHCAAALPSWQVPRDFWMLDALPVNERGKLSRRELSKQYALR